MQEYIQLKNNVYKNYTKFTINNGAPIIALFEEASYTVIENIITIDEDAFYGGTYEYSISGKKIKASSEFVRIEATKVSDSEVAGVLEDPDDLQNLSFSRNKKF